MSGQDLDMDNLLMLKELLAERFDELVETFLTDTGKRLEMMERALRSHDLATLGLHAHGLKGSSRNIGANPLADLCETLEAQAREGQVQNGQQQLTAIAQKIAAVSEILKSI